MIAPWYALSYIQLDRVAMRHGYCLALHGSMGRDLDLVAIPWTEDADEPEKLLRAIQRFIKGKSKVTFHGLPQPTKKPHGRIAYAIPINFEGNYLDVSIMPKIKKGKK